MRNLLALVGLVIVLFFGIGWYRGWYTFEVEPGTDGKKKIELNVDTRKIESDVIRTKEGVENLRENRTPSTEAPKASIPSPFRN